MGDRYAGSWTVDAFGKKGIRYNHSERDRSTIYSDALPLFSSGRARLVDNPKLVSQFANLERRTSLGGRDRIDHPSWTPIFGYEAAQAIKSRKAILDRVATDRVCHGLSLPVPGDLDMSSDATRHTTGNPSSGPGSERMTSLRRHTMSSKQERFRIAVLDDYQDVALSLADWSVLDARATVTVFNDHLADPTPSSSACGHSTSSA